MNKTISGLMLALLTIVGAAQVYAAERERGFSGRQQFQQHRIQQGVRSGDLTRSETRNLQRGARDIAQTEQRFRADGRFTRGERHALNQDLNRQSRDIQRERHDGERHWAGHHDQDRRGFGHNRHWANNDHFRHGDRRHHGWEHNRGHHYGWWNGRGHHYGHHGHRGHPTFGSNRSIDARQHWQRERIMQGLRSGELTRHEAERLFAEQRMIRREERRYLADGVLSPWERRDLHRDLDAAGQHIYNETHDDQRRF
jgi:hypothetical protein